MGERADARMPRFVEQIGPMVLQRGSLARDETLASDAAQREKNKTRCVNSRRTCRTRRPAE
jgi:hypothetical protein